MKAIHHRGRRFYAEQRVWLLGSEMLAPPRPAGQTLSLDALLAPGARATVRYESEYFSNFKEAGEFDHLRIVFNRVALQALASRLECSGLRLLGIIPRISRHGYLSLTSIYALDSSVPLDQVEELGVQLAMQMDGQFHLFDGICTALERAGMLEFPYAYRFGVPDILAGSAHTPLYAFGFNQHILLLGERFPDRSAEALHLDQATPVEIEGFRMLGGWSVYLWTPEDVPHSRIVHRWAELLVLDNVLSVQSAVLACGLSAATELLGKIVRDDPQISAPAVRNACLVHRRMEQRMKLRERELLEIQKSYVREQFAQSDYEDLREAYDRAEASLLTAAEGLEAARQQSIAAWANVILGIVAVLGTLSVFTAAVDFGYWFPLEQRPVTPGARRVSLLLVLLILTALAFMVRQLLLAGGNRQRSGGRGFRFFQRRRTLPRDQEDGQRI